MKWVLLALLVFSLVANAETQEEMHKWVKELNSGKFSEREKAHTALKKAGEKARPILAATLGNPSSVEQLSRLRALMEPMTDRPASYSQIGGLLVKELSDSSSCKLLKQTADKILNQMTYQEFIQLGQLEESKAGLKDFRQLRALYTQLLERIGAKNIRPNADSFQIIFILNDKIFRLSYFYLGTFHLDELDDPLTSNGNIVNYLSIKNVLLKNYSATTIQHLIFPNNKRVTDQTKDLKYRQVLIATHGEDQYEMRFYSPFSGTRNAHDFVENALEKGANLYPEGTGKSESIPNFSDFSTKNRTTIWKKQREKDKAPRS